MAMVGKPLEIVEVELDPTETPQPYQEDAPDKKSEPQPTHKPSKKPVKVGV